MLGQICRFTVVGILNTVIDFGIFNILISLSGMKSGLFLLLINMAAVTTAIINSFILNRVWTFKSSEPAYGIQFPKFILVSLTGMLVNTATVGLFALLSPAPDASYLMLNAAKLVAAVLSASWNFMFYRYWVFKKDSAESEHRSYQPSLTSIIIPAYNEATRLPQRLHNLASTLPSRFPIEIIVVDDGSNDSTREKAQAFCAKHPQVSCLSHPRNQGKGKAVRTGIQAAKGEFLIFCDADDTFTPQHIEALRNQLQAGSKIAIACRHSYGSQRMEGESRQRRLLGRAFNLLVQALLLPGIKDSQCGLKGFHCQAAQDIFSRQRLNRFAFDVEVLVLARALQYEIAELPVKATDCAGSRVNPLLAPAQMLLDLFSIKARLFFNLYALPGGNQAMQQCAFVLAAFTAALGLRLPWLWEIPRFIDELKEVRLSYLIYAGQLLPLHNAAWDIGAMHNYIMAGFFKILGPSIYVPRLYVAVTAALTVPLIYYLGSRLFGRRTGLLAAALLLFNGMHILVTHMAWSNCTTPFFFTLALIATIKAEEKKSGPWLVLAALAWAAALQTHSSVIVYLLATAFYLLRPSFRQQVKISPRWYFAAALALLAGYANMIYFNIISRGGSLRWLSHKSYTLEQDPGISSYILNCYNMAVQLLRTLSSTYSHHDHLLQYLVHPFFSLSLLLLLTGLIVAWKQKKVLPLCCIAAAFLIIPNLNERYGFFLNTRYIMPVFICALLLMSAGAVHLYDCMHSLVRSQRGIRALAIATAAMLVCLQFVPYYNYCRSKEVTNESNRLALNVIAQTEQLSSGDDYLVLLDQGLSLENDPLPYLLGFKQRAYLKTSIPGNFKSDDEVNSWLTSLGQDSSQYIAVLTADSYSKVKTLIQPGRADSFACMITFPRPADRERKIYVVELKTGKQTKRPGPTQDLIR
ncbi:glycosyltransferase [Syntrophomonas curvata]